MQALFSSLSWISLYPLAVWWYICMYLHVILSALYLLSTTCITPKPMCVNVYMQNHNVLSLYAWTCVSIWSVWSEWRRGWRLVCVYIGLQEKAERAPLPHNTPNVDSFYIYVNPLGPSTHKYKQRPDPIHSINQKRSHSD